MCGGAGKLLGRGINTMFLGATDAVGLTGSGSLLEPGGDLLPTAATPATTAVGDVNSASTAARDDEKRRRAAAAGLSSTILGGSTAGTTTATKSLLGQ